MKGDNVESEERDEGAAWQTAYGMAWRARDASAVVQVQRTASIDGRAILHIWTTGAHDGGGLTSLGIEIYVSKAGRSIRVFDRKTGREMKVTP